jgi:hypothetical protein
MPQLQPSGITQICQLFTNINCNSQGGPREAMGPAAQKQAFAVPDSTHTHEMTKAFAASKDPAN